MWIVRLALARPYTFIVMALVVILLTPVVLLRTPTDIFPEINIPVISLVWSYNGLSPQAIFDFGNNFIRTQLATVQGAALPFPYGGKQRQITVDLSSEALQSKGLSPVDIVNAVNAQNLILPTGTAKFGTLEYNVEMNGAPQTIQELNDFPVKTVNGATI